MSATTMAPRRGRRARRAVTPHPRHHDKGPETEERADDGPAERARKAEARLARHRHDAPQRTTRYRTDRQTPSAAGRGERPSHRGLFRDNVQQTWNVG